MPELIPPCPYDECEVTVNHWHWLDKPSFVRPSMYCRCHPDNPVHSIGSQEATRCYRPRKT